MTFILNEYDVANVVDQLADRDDLPNLRRAAATLARLVKWTNRSSDGWPYWRKPGNASAKLQQALADWQSNYRRGQEDIDISDAQLRKLFTPIKAFLTRQGADHDLVFCNDHRSIFSQEA